MEKLEVLANFLNGREYKTFSEYLEEKFSDIGKLSDEELSKGKRLDKEEEGNFKEVEVRVFL